MRAALAASPTIIIQLQPSETFVLKVEARFDVEIRVDAATIHPDHIHLSGQRVAKLGYTMGTLGVTMYDTDTEEGIPESFRAVLRAARQELATTVIRLASLSQRVQKKLAEAQEGGRT